MATKKTTCTECGKAKATEKNFYMSQSNMYKKNDGRVTICKDCTMNKYDRLVEKYEDEFKALYHLCMNLDVYYSNSLAESLYPKIKRDGKDNLAKIYFSKINSLQQYKDLTSVESDIMILDEQYVEEYVAKKENKNTDVESNFKITPQVLKRWGLGMTEEDYFFLESKYEEFTSAYDHRTPAQKQIFEQICKSLLEGEKARKSGNIAGFEKMNNVFSKLMGDNNIKPNQEASLAEDETQGWGVWVNRIETERPVGEPCEAFKDVDRISSYITKWFTKQMQKVFDLNDGGDEVDTSESASRKK